MKISGLFILLIFLFSVCLLWGNYPLQQIERMPASDGAESGYVPENPPPIDSLCLVFSGIDYGDPNNSPQAYPSAKHITNVMVGSYYFPVVTWETGDAWGKQSLFSYWDDMFKFWSYPDSFTSNNAIDTGRPAMCSDSKGNLHFAWHQLGNPDGYEIFYTRAFLDTSAGVIQYSVERPATMISITNGQEETFPSIAIYGDTLIMVVYPRRMGTDRNAIAYNYSTDGGNTWAGQALAYDHGGIMPGSWIQPSIGPDPNNGNMWVTVNFDYTGNACMDITALYWEAATNNWSIELAAEGQVPPNDDALCMPAIVVDYNGIPHIIFAVNIGSGGGGLGGLWTFGACGPAGTLFYIHRSGGTWAPRSIIEFPRYEVCNYESGWPSLGIATDNTIYFSTTQPESATPDTSAFLPFNVYYAEISPYTGAVSYGGKVSNLTFGDSANTIYAHTTYNVPLGGEVPSGTEGPGITWCQLINEAPPSDCYYNHMDSLLAVKETKTVSNPSPVTLYQNYPNPAHNKTMIRFTVPSNTFISLDIYDISGRLVKTLAKGVPGAGSYFVVWDGKDLNGKATPGGVYLYTLRAGLHKETRKLLLIH
ncbi:MAG: T9SS type A sorting domain-containing protein [Candidatus Cloacimonadota bacterium]|nr:MAG: T9SS type A sorting domain-containing protein [Candidatus Cloacimonadota bacterium]